MTKPTTAEALRIARDELENYAEFDPTYPPNTKPLNSAAKVWLDTADVQDHIPEAEKMMLTDDEILNIAEDVGISNYVAYRLSKEFARAVLAAQAKKGSA